MKVQVWDQKGNAYPVIECDRCEAVGGVLLFYLERNDPHPGIFIKDWSHAGAIQPLPEVVV